MSNSRLAIAFILVLSLSACGDDGDGGNMGGAGMAGSAGGAAGSVAGMGMAGAAAGMDAAGMGGEGGGGMGGEGGGGSMGEPTFTAIFDEIIIGTGCNGSALCHSGTVGMLTMNDKQETYDALVNVPAMGTNLTGMGMNCVDSGVTRVVPGDPDASLLVQKVEGTQPCGDAMPPGAALLPEAQQQQIRMWVQLGAKND